MLFAEGMSESISPSLIDVSRDQRRREAWQRLIDAKLAVWLRDPNKVEDEGIDAPTATIVTVSLNLAERFMAAGFPPPDGIVPDPNGGIVFERREDHVSEVLHVWDDGSVEYMRYHGTRLAERQLLASRIPIDEPEGGIP